MLVLTRRRASRELSQTKVSTVDVCGVTEREAVNADCPSCSDEVLNPVAREPQTSLPTL